MAEYYYLVSSLPMLEKYAEPFLSTDSFVESCKDWLTDADLSLVKSVGLVPASGASFPSGTAAAKWNDWEINLRNKVAKSRAGKLNREAEEDTLPATDCYSELDRAIQEVAAAHNPLEAEKVLDDMRWTKVDDLEACHSFDVDKLCAYKIKLMLCEKWLVREESKGVESFNQVIDSLYTEQVK